MTSTTVQFLTDIKNDMTPETVAVRTSSSVNNYGERSFAGGATTYDAYVEKSNEVIRNENEERIADYKVFIPDASLNINPEDQITLPAPISAVRPIIKVERRTDNFGQQCVVVYCGKNTRG